MQTTSEVTYDLEALLLCCTTRIQSATVEDDISLTRAAEL